MHRWVVSSRDAQLPSARLLRRSTNGGRGTNPDARSSALRATRKSRQQARAQRVSACSDSQVAHALWNSVRVLKLCRARKGTSDDVIGDYDAPALRRRQDGRSAREGAFGADRPRADVSAPEANAAEGLARPNSQQRSLQGESRSPPARVAQRLPPRTPGAAPRRQDTLRVLRDQEGAADTLL